MDLHTAFTTAENSASPERRVAALSVIRAALDQSGGLHPAEHYTELISAALEIHRPRPSNLWRGGACVACSGRSPVEYPCATALALGVPRTGA